MKLITLKIEYSDMQKRLFSKTDEIIYNFYGQNTLITSKSSNSKGKTTLIRFILYSLGYKVTQTDGMNIYDYKTTLEIEYRNKRYFLIHNKNEQFIIDEIGDKIYRKIGDKDEQPPMISILWGISNKYIANSLLGCFYIDQDKGWTLLNRGAVIGSYKFNIEAFFINLYEKNEVEINFMENKILKKNIDRANALINILKDSFEYEEISDENRDNILKSIIKMENEISDLEQISFLKRKEIRSLKNLLSENINFMEKIENMNIVIEHKGENIIVDRNKLKNFNLNNDILVMRKNELEFELNTLKKEIEVLKSNINKIRKENRQDNANEYLKKAFNAIKLSGLSVQSIEASKKDTQFKIKNNDKIIRKEICNGINEFWNILEPILKELELGKNYINKDIILTDRLVGISGAQLQQLSLAFKLSLNILIREKLGLSVPFIIDSPKSSETSDRISNLMLNLLKKYIPKNQIIVSSVYDDYEMEFKNKIEIKEGVIKELNKFI